MGILALVTARGGSKGVPRKNILRAGGKPLIAWTIEAARQAARLLARKSSDWTIDRILASTDSARIRDVCLEFGAEAPFLRPAHLAGDDSSHIDTVRHALEWLEQEQKYRPQWVLLLQPTSPLRTAEDICGVVDLAHSRRPPAVISVCETHAHPYLARKLTAGDVLGEFVGCPLKYPRRQDLPAAYTMNGAIYFTQRETLLKENTFEPQGTIGYVMPVERSIQVDTAWDLHLLELILRDRGHEPDSQLVDPSAQRESEFEQADTYELHRISEK